MDNHERKVVEAVKMELSDMSEKLQALHEYLTDSLNSERSPNVKNPDNSNSGRDGENT